MNQGRREWLGVGLWVGVGGNASRFHGNWSPLHNSLPHTFFLSWMWPRHWKVEFSPAEHLLPVDGVEVDDLVGLGRNKAVVKGSRWWRGGVWGGVGRTGQEVSRQSNALSSYHICKNNGHFWGPVKHCSPINQYKTRSFNIVLTVLAKNRFKRLVIHHRCTSFFATFSTLSF